MKIGVVYTSTTPELIELVNKELVGHIGPDAQYLNYADPSILSEIVEAGYVTSAAASRLMAMYTKAIGDGADAILNCCSSVGEVADSAKAFAAFTGIPIVRIDEEMCRKSVLAGTRIGVMATLSTTLEPTKHTLMRVARENHRNVELVDGLIDGAFNLSQDAFRTVMLEKARELGPKTDVLLFAQGSMAYCESYIHEKTGKTVFSSPRFGAEAVAAALRNKGLIGEDHSHVR